MLSDRAGFSGFIELHTHQSCLRVLHGIEAVAAEPEQVASSQTRVSAVPPQEPVRWDTMRNYTFRPFVQ